MSKSHKKLLSSYFQLAVKPHAKPSEPSMRKVHRLHYYHDGDNVQGTELH